MRRRVATALAAAALAAVAAGASSAAAALPPGLLRPVATRAETPGSGQLAAQGSGIVSLQGRLLTYGRVLGPGLIVIRDPAGDAVVRVNGRLRRVPRSGVLRVRLIPSSAKGSAFYIQDSSGLRVRIMGVVLDVAAAGKGNASLDGDGNFSVNGSVVQHSWADADSPLRLHPSGRAG